MFMVAANTVVVPTQLLAPLVAQALQTMEYLHHQQVVQHLLARLFHPQTISQFQ